MKRAVVLTGLLTGISVMAFAAPAACPTCADTEKTERGVDIVVANTAPVAEPDWEVLLQSRVREADRLGLLRKAQRETADNMKRHAETPVDLKLPRAKATESRRLVLLDEASVRAMAEPVKAVFAGLCADTCFLTPMTKSSLPLSAICPKSAPRFVLWPQPETSRKPRADWESDFMPIRAAR